VLTDRYLPLPRRGIGLAAIIFLRNAEIIDDCLMKPGEELLSLSYTLAADLGASASSSIRADHLYRVAALPPFDGASIPEGVLHLKMPVRTAGIGAGY
jgi:hypothetical protein